MNEWMNEQKCFFNVRAAGSSHSDAKAKNKKHIAFWPFGFTALLRVLDTTSDGPGIFHEHCVLYSLLFLVCHYPCSCPKSPYEVTYSNHCALSKEISFNQHLLIMKLCATQLVLAVWMHASGVGVEQKVTNERKRVGGKRRIKESGKIWIFIQALFIMYLL